MQGGAKLYRPTLFALEGSCSNLGQGRADEPHSQSQTINPSTRSVLWIISDESLVWMPDQTLCLGSDVGFVQTDQITNSSAWGGLSKMLVLFPSKHPFSSITEILLSSIVIV